MRKLLVILFFAILLCGCSPNPRPSKEYQPGDIVVHTVSGLKGQVIHVVWPYDGQNNWVYVVRFPIITDRIPDHILGSGGTVEVQAFSSQIMRGYELRRSE